MKNQTCTNTPMPQIVFLFEINDIQIKAVKIKKHTCVFCIPFAFKPVDHLI